MWARKCEAVPGATASSYEGGGAGTDSDSDYYTLVTTARLRTELGQHRDSASDSCSLFTHNQTPIITITSELKRKVLPLFLGKVHFRLNCLYTLYSPQWSKHAMPWLATEVFNIVHQSSMETHRVKQLNTSPESRLKLHWNHWSWHNKESPGSGHCQGILWLHTPVHWSSLCHPI